MTAPFAVWIDRDVVRASGPETATFLQGQLSQEVESLAIGQSTWSLLLQPNGKIDSWLRVSRDVDDAMWLDVDGGFGDALIARLSRFKLRTKCDLEIVRDWKCVAVRGAAVPDDADGARPIVWPGTSGFDLLGPSVDPPPAVEIVDATAYERARIEAGVPALGAELTEATIPAEAGQWLVDASVSFTKGCFTGQELVARMDARGGNAPRPIRGLHIHGSSEAGDEVAIDGNVIGALTSAAAADDGATVALAPLNRTIAIDTEVEVAGQAGCVVALPMT